ncbi:MAG: TolC family protein [Candidatus Obscuribacterales bacterium]|nr:TolC family protein [Candidatus Obscuribacterales bacterium]
MQRRLLAILPIMLAFLAAGLWTQLMAIAEEAPALRPAVLEPVTLPQAVQSSLDNNVQIKNSRLDVEINDAKISSARTRIFPEFHMNAVGLQLLAPLEFDFNKGVFGNFKATGPIPAEKINVTTDQRPVLFLNTSLVQPITQISRIRLAIRQAELSKSIAQQKYRLQKQQVSNQVRRAYYRILESEDNLKVLDSTRQMFREIERVSTNYLANKMVLPAELLEVKQQLANVEYETLKLSNAIANQKEELSRLLGRDIKNDFQLAHTPDTKLTEMDLRDAQGRALTQRAELLQTSFQTQQLDLERRIRKQQQLPQMSLVMNYFSIFGAQILPKNVIFAGLLVHWEPMETLRKSYEISEQKKLIQQSSNSLKDLQTQILIEVNTTHRTLQECKQFVQVAALGRELAAEKLRVVSNKYKEKAALLKDVLQAQKDLTQADNRATQATLALWTARADFEKAIGED